MTRLLRYLHELLIRRALRRYISRSDRPDSDSPRHRIAGDYRKHFGPGYDGG
jgi:hypothetical protein